jgi:drug/metabolite transporter (DMT)-like permease
MTPASCKHVAMSRRAWAAFVAVALLWGVPYLFIRIAVGEVSPVFVAWVRLVIAAAVLIPFAAYRGSLPKAFARWRWVLLLGSYYMALAWTLIPIAERVLPSSLTAIMIAGVPIMVTLINLRRDRPSPLRIAGLGLGFAGVAALVGLDVGIGPSQLFAVACVVVVLVCYASGPVMTSRKLKGIDPVAISALAAAFAALILTPIVVFQLPGRVPSSGVIGSLAGLGFLCSAVALVAWFFLIQEAGPNRATIVIYINPVIAVLAGVAVLHEHIGVVSLAGMVLILAGSWLATTGRIPLMKAAPATT